MPDPQIHIPVLKKQVLNLLLRDDTGVYMDGTLGFGGHASAILDNLKSPGLLIGLDRDPEVLSFTQNHLSSKYNNRLFSLHQMNYREFPEILNKLGIAEINGILLDVGVSSFNIDNPERGFSFRFDGPLDMRFNRSKGMSACDLLNEISENDLSIAIRDFGQERYHKKIADYIVRQVKLGKMNTTGDLKEAICSAVKGPHQSKTLARVFQAIRITVNDELGALKDVLEKAVQYVGSGGRIAVISFHSLEDKIVKRFFKEKAISCVCPKELPQCICGVEPQVRILTRKAVIADDMEIEQNQRSRSAKLRVAEVL